VGVAVADLLEAAADADTTGGPVANRCRLKLNQQTSFARLPLAEGKLHIDL
jgi:hypothetical protein